MATNSSKNTATAPASPEMDAAELEALEARIAELEAQKQAAIDLKAAQAKAAAMAAVDEALVQARAVLATGEMTETLQAINHARDEQIERMREAGVKAPGRRSGSTAGSGGSGRGTKVSEPGSDHYDRRVFDVLVGTPGTAFTNAELMQALTQDGGSAPSTGGAVPNAAKSLTIKTLDVPGTVKQTTVEGTIAYVFEPAAA